MFDEDFEVALYDKFEEQEYAAKMDSILKRCLESGEKFDHLMGEYLAGF